MGWDYKDIERDWMRGGTLSFAPDVMVAAFDRAERILGSEWVLSFLEGGTRYGLMVTFQVVSMGVKLGAIEDLSNVGGLIEALRNGERAAEAELTALYLLRHEHKLETELYPEVAVGDGVRVPDFRVRSEEGVWIYVEVTQADTSEKQKRVEAIMGRLSAPVSRVKKSFALEVILEREPTGQELDELDGAIFELCQLEGEHRVDLPGLARLSVGGSPPDVAVVTERLGEWRPDLQELRQHGDVIWGEDLLRDAADMRELIARGSAPTTAGRRWHPRLLLLRLVSAPPPKK